MEEDIQKLIDEWRAYADGNYCQTYNKSVGLAVHLCADSLEQVLIKSRLTKRALDLLPCGHPASETVLDTVTKELSCGVCGASQ